MSLIPFCDSASPEVSPHAALSMSVCASLSFLHLLSVFSGFHMPKSLFGKTSSHIPASWQPRTVGSQAPTQIPALPAANGWLWASVWRLLCGQPWCSQLLCHPDPSLTGTKNEAGGPWALTAIQCRNPNPTARAENTHTNLIHPDPLTHTQFGGCTRQATQIPHPGRTWCPAAGSAASGSGHPPAVDTCCPFRAGLSGREHLAGSHTPCWVAHIR